MERSCSQQEQLIRDIVLSTHGLLQPLCNDAKYENVAFIIEALLHMVDAKSLDAQWRMQVVPHLAEEWRLIFLWGQLIIVMAHGEAQEAIEEALSDCEPHERVLLAPLANAYLSTDAQLHQGNDVEIFSQDSLCGDLFAIDMAEYYFEQGNNEIALSWIGDKLQYVQEMVNSNEWLDGARDIVHENAPDSALMATLIACGVERNLPGALYLRAELLHCRELLIKNAASGHSGSMVRLAEYLRGDNLEEEANQWLLRAAGVFNSDALYLLGDIHSDKGLNYLTQAVQRLHGNTLFDVALAVLNNEVQWKDHAVILQVDGVQCDPPQAVYLLKKARDAGVGEAATLLVDLLSSYLDEATFFSMCYAAGQVDTKYIEIGYTKALELKQADKILEWSTSMIFAFGERKDVLFERGVAAHWKGQMQDAVQAWTQAASMGHNLSAQMLDDFHNGNLPTIISSVDKGWSRTWKSIAARFRRT